MVGDISTKGAGLMEQNPIAVVQAKFKEVETMFRGWLAKQSLPVEAAVVTVTSGAQGAAIGAFMGTLSGDASSLVTPPPNAGNLNPDAMASLKQAQVYYPPHFAEFIYSSVNCMLYCRCYFDYS